MPYIFCKRTIPWHIRVFSGVKINQLSSREPKESPATSFKVSKGLVYYPVPQNGNANGTVIFVTVLRQSPFMKSPNRLCVTFQQHQGLDRYNTTPSCIIRIIAFKRTNLGIYPGHWAPKLPLVARLLIYDYKFHLQFNFFLL